MSSAPFQPRDGRLLVRLALVLVGIVIALVLAELGMRGYAAWSMRGVPSGPPGPKKFTPCDCPYVYGSNPAKPEISSQGLRDREYGLPRPEGVDRVLILGDSVPFGPGPGIGPQHTFPKVLEKRLAARNRNVEVVNGGVSGYTTWNELRWYEARGREFGAALVILVVCLNDVNDPELHWDALGETVKKLPEGSIPNPAYHEEVIEPVLRFYRRRKSPSLLDRYLSARWYKKWADRRLERDGYETIDGRRVPIYLSREDTLSVHVWLDPESAEWRWWTALVRELRDKVEADGARFVIATAPLAYQLDEDYPYFPQTAIGAWCAAENIAHLDLLPALAEHPKPRVFLLDSMGFDDIWHFTARGHEVVAEAIDAFLE